MILLLVSLAVAVVTRNFVRIPYTIALVLAGLLIGFTHLIESFHLSKALILVLFLPPLLFEGALNMELEIFWRQLPGVLLLAAAGTLLSTGSLGIAAHYILGLDWPLSMLLGAILSPTDPVSVLALFREQGVDRELAMTVEGESVLNDGLGVVLYLIFLQSVIGETAGFPKAAEIFIWEVLIGASSGFALGYLCYRLLSKIDDHLIEITVSILLAFGSYFVAERFHASGVMAVVVAGIIMGNYGQVLSMSPHTRLALTHFWEVIAFLINSLLFLLIGIDMDSTRVIRQFADIAAIFAAMTGIRFLLVWSFAAILSMFGRPWIRSWKPAIAWGGLKGSIPIALALGLPSTIPNRLDMVALIFGVVLLSLITQGLSFRIMIRKLGLASASEQQVRLEETLGRLMEVNAALQNLEALWRAGTIPSLLYNEKVADLKKERGRLEDYVEKSLGESPELRTLYTERLDRDILSTRLSAVSEGLRRGVLKTTSAEKRRARLLEQEKESAPSQDAIETKEK